MIPEYKTPQAHSHEGYHLAWLKSYISSLNTVSSMMRNVDRTFLIYLFSHCISGTIHAQALVLYRFGSLE